MSGPENIQQYVGETVLNYLRERDAEVQELRQFKWRNTCGVCHEILGTASRSLCPTCARPLCYYCHFLRRDQNNRCNDCLK